MPVTVRLFAAARAAVGANEVIVPAGSLAYVLNVVEAGAPPFGKVRPACSFLINEVAVHGEEGEILVQEGDVVDVLPPFAGG